jgi:hypothetical protein
VLAQVQSGPVLEPEEGAIVKMLDPRLKTLLGEENERGGQLFSTAKAVRNYEEDRKQKISEGVDTTLVTALSRVPPLTTTERVLYDHGDIARTEWDELIGVAQAELASLVNESDQVLEAAKFTVA